MQDGEGRRIFQDGSRFMDEDNLVQGVSGSANDGRKRDWAQKYVTKKCRSVRCASLNSVVKSRVVSDRIIPSSIQIPILNILQKTLENS